MYVCMYYVCMYVRNSACYSARRSLFGALIGALVGIDVSQVEYTCTMNACIYQRAESTGSTIYVCMHGCMHALCMYMHVCMYAIRRADHYSARRSARWVIGMLNMHVI